MSVTQTLSGPGTQTNPQLAKINYHRPDTWRFFFYAQCLQANGSAGTVNVLFDLIIGIGRGQSTIQGFATLLLPAALSNGFQAYTTSVPASSVVPTATVFPIDEFPAQDIQCTARIQAVGTTAPVVVEAAAYFSPNAHVRPDWFEHDYPGGETGGT